MEAVTLQALKAILLILPGLISLRVKAALSISSPSKPLNAAIDGLVLTLVDHATLEPDGTLLPIQGQGVLLTRENPIIRVELWAPGARDSMTPGGSVNV